LGADSHFFGIIATDHDWCYSLAGETRVRSDTNVIAGPIHRRRVKPERICDDHDGHRSAAREDSCCTLWFKHMYHMNCDARRGLAVLFARAPSRRDATPPGHEALREPRPASADSWDVMATNRMKSSTRKRGSSSSRSRNIGSNSSSKRGGGRRTGAAKSGRRSTAARRSPSRSRRSRAVMG
jgi:hypothetical protein